MKKVYRGIEYHKYSLLFVLSCVMFIVFLIASCSSPTSESTESESEADSTQTDSTQTDSVAADNSAELIAQ